jgi:hypothetical protein
MLHHSVQDSPQYLYPCVRTHLDDDANLCSDYLEGAPVSDKRTQTHLPSRVYLTTPLLSPHS